MDVRLGPADLQEGELRPFEVQGRYVLIARIEGQLHALDDQCNHAGCLLSSGWLEQSAVVCPCHEYKFDVITGKNVTYPRLCEDQPSFPLTISEGEIIVTLPEKV